MKALPLLISHLFLLLSSLSQAQEFDIQACGLDSSYALNADEAAYFNEILSKERGDFDFFGKKIAFATGNSGHIPSNKYQYFAQDGRLRYQNGQNVVNQLIILTAAEKAELAGIDAIVVSWSKVNIQGRQRQKLVARLNE
ncbi:MAG: hypothetical protein AAF927_16710 [Bacteroidota bacterium]